MTALRNAQIILPRCDNNGHQLASLHAWLAKTLAKEFGGLTTCNGTGEWIDDNGVLFIEAVAIYNVAMEDCPINVERLHQIARLAGQDAKQLAMYVQNPDGTVHILNTKD